MLITEKSDVFKMVKEYVVTYSLSLVPDTDEEIRAAMNYELENPTYDLGQHLPMMTYRQLLYRRAMKTELAKLLTFRETVREPAHF